MTVNRDGAETRCDAPGGASDLGMKFQARNGPCAHHMRKFCTRHAGMSNKMQAPQLGKRISVMWSKAPSLAGQNMHFCAT